MISEKTVELNLTTELVNWMGKVHQSTFTAIAPSQRQEAKLGFDVSIVAKGTGFFIQYKRAHKNGSEYIYDLNRTSARDQHQRLCALESAGVPVLYALPLFTTVTEVLQFRRSLLKRTLWLSPKSIPVPGGGIGHHEVHFDESTGRHWVTSAEEVDFLPEDPDGRLTALLRSIRGKDNLMDAMSAFNRIFVGDTRYEQDREFGVNDFDDSSISGIALMAAVK